jgi:hypothetical protein
MMASGTGNTSGTEVAEEYLFDLIMQAANFPGTVTHADLIELAQMLGWSPKSCGVTAGE